MISEQTIQKVVTDHKCCSCGICAGVCPTGAISMKIDACTGSLLPVIHEEQCVHCRACLRTCPGLSTADAILAENPSESDYHNRQCSAIAAYTGSITDHTLLENCTSGGIVSELVRTLLTESKYEAAFLVNTNQYADAAKSVRVKEFSYHTSKSRYVAVSHEDAVRYMLAHREERLIIVAVSCAVKGFRQVIKQYQLNSENYLLIGLFCDKVMTYKIWDYLSAEYAQSGHLSGLDFRNKRESGWPGDMRLYFDDKPLRVSRKERMNVKNFFQNERCLYCIDKLNEAADISVGDNYTGANTPKEGSSSIIVRTKAGAYALDQIKHKCTLIPISADKLYESQRLQKKLKNLCNARIKYQGLAHAKVSLKNALRFHKNILMIKIGRSYIRTPLLLRMILKWKKILK